MSVYVEHHQTPSYFNNSDSWIILSKIEACIKSKIETVGKPLKEWNININRGILTGLNEAFIINTETRDYLIAADPKSAEIIRPILRGRDISRFNYNFSELWLLFIPWHFPLQNDNSITGASALAEEQFKINYPDVYDHLLQYKPKLEKRNKAETGIRYEWYALQRWGAKYVNDFSKQKIVFQEMVQSPCFCLDSDRHFMLLDTGRIITGEHLEYLLCLLNSTLFFFAIKHFYGGGALGEKGVRMKHTFFEKFNAYVPTEEEEHTLSELIKNDISSDTSRVIDNFFYTVYGLSREEIEFLENQL